MGQCKRLSYPSPLLPLLQQANLAKEIMTAMAPHEDPQADPNADVAEMPYEEARDELAKLVDKMQSGQLPLDLTVHLWERGEALASRCEALLLAATERVQGTVTDADSPKDDEPF